MHPMSNKSAQYLGRVCNNYCRRNKLNNEIQSTAALAMICSNNVDLVCLSSNNYIYVCKYLNTLKG